MKKKIIILTAILVGLTVISLVCIILIDRFVYNWSLDLSDWMASICAILSLIGTVSLAIVAVLQTDKANKQNQALIEQNKELQKINDLQFKIANQEKYPYLQIVNTQIDGSNDKNSSIPFFADFEGFTRVDDKDSELIVYCLNCNEDKALGHTISLYIDLRNESEAKIVNIKIYKVRLIKPVEKIFDVYWEIIFSKSGSGFHICINHDRIKNERVECTLFFEMETNTGITFYQNIKIFAYENNNFLDYGTISQNRLD